VRKRKSVPIKLKRLSCGLVDWSEDLTPQEITPNIAEGAYLILKEESYILKILPFFAFNTCKLKSHSVISD